MADVVQRRALAMKTIIATLLLSAFMTINASAQFIGPSAQTKIVKVEELQTARRGQEATLQGYVIKHLRDRYYLFRDTSGEIRVRIDRPLWRNRRVTSKDRIRLSGRIDRDFQEFYLNVSRLELIE
jgi:uncharacterized protein (TIGR00156 family)